MSSSTKNICILGATGSIGVNTLRVIDEHPDKYNVYALSAHSNIDLLFTQCCKHKPQFAVIASESLAEDLKRRLVESGIDTEVLYGEEGLVTIASHKAVDSVMAAIVGGAGLLPTMSAVKAGKKVLLANKEALVMAGELFMQSALESQACLLPIDSEHNAIFQCLPINEKGQFKHKQAQGFSKIVLTGSGGPFRTFSEESLHNVTPDQACAHPTWSMGRKISVDSATMINKALELIEASYLFNTPAEHIDILIHPESIIHSMVYYSDGSVLAQLGNPDMRTPIAYCLAWPNRIDAGLKSLDLAELATLHFEKVDNQRFPGLKLGRAVAEAKGAETILFNAANEIAVAAFLNGDLRFTQIPVIIDRILQKGGFLPPKSLEDVLEIDSAARIYASECVISINK